MNTDLDHLTRFLLPAAGVRGVVVSLDECWAEIQAREQYPDGLRDLLGECAAAAALFTGHIKFDGRLSIHLKGSTAVSTVFAECSQGRTLRAIALWDGEVPAPLSPRQLGSGALLAITIEKFLGGQLEPQRYQGMVALDAERLAIAFEDYFQQSEQLPTRVLLAADGRRARGLMLQQLPSDHGDADGWNRAQALFDTLGARELLETDCDLLLHRLFHEEAVERLSREPLAFACSCSRERVAALLQTLGHDETLASIDPTLGAVSVQCEFCGQRYRFDPVDIEALFSAGGSPPGSQRVN